MFNLALFYVAGNFCNIIWFVCLLDKGRMNDLKRLKSMNSNFLAFFFAF